MVEEVTDPEDDLTSFKLKPQTERKLIFIRKMMEAVNTIVAAKFPDNPRHYVDMFSGVGKYVTERGSCCLGSPLIALNIRKKFTHFHFVEEKKKYFEVLERRVGQIVERKNIPRANVKLLYGDANRLVEEVLNGIKNYDPCFVFLDPFGLEMKNPKLPLGVSSD